ncbi:hypothetical protein EMCRGX_G005524 [Ephydatia muelleri]
MEGLLRHLTSCPYGYRLSDNITINHLAYADDICVLAGSRMQGQALLDRCVEFTSWAGLTFNAKKCGSLCAVNNVSPVYVDPTPLHLSNDAIPALTWRQRYKYLGCPVGAGSSHDLTSIKDSLLRDCEQIMKSQLAEWQKLDAYRRFLSPRLTYVMKIFFPGSSWCRKLDTGTRKWLKKAVCLPSRACSSFLYTPQSLGGLGVPCFEDEMHVARVAQSFKFLADTRDPVVRQTALLQLEAVVRRRARIPRSSPLSIDHLSTFLNTSAPSQEGARGDLKSLWSSVRSSLRYTHSTIHLSSESASVTCGGVQVRWAKRHDISRVLKLETQTRHLTALQEAPDQGRASFSTCLADSSNYFTYSGAYLTFPQYRFALRARLNLLPTRTVQARCVLERLIRATPPSLGDKFKEQPLPNTTGANRADLTIIAPDGRSVILVDVCIPFEGVPEALQDAAQEKVRKYEPLRQTLLSRFERVEVLPFVVGSLGSWFPPNEEVLRKLHIGWRYAALMRRLCVASAIAGSQDIWFRSTCSIPGTNVPGYLQAPDLPPPPAVPLNP